jgi:hypothetical protein
MVTALFPIKSVASLTSKQLHGSSHPLGDFDDKPAQCGETNDPEKHDRDHRRTRRILQESYDVSAGCSK